MTKLPSSGSLSPSATNVNQQQSESAEDPASPEDDSCQEKSDLEEGKVSATEGDKIETMRFAGHGGRVSSISTRVNRKIGFSFLH